MTLRDAGDYISILPKAEQLLEERQAAVEVEKAYALGTPGVPALTGSADIKLNSRLSLRTPTEKIASRTGSFPGPNVAKPSVKTFSGWRSCLKQDTGLIIRYSSYGSSNYRTNQSAPTELLCPLEKEYRELQDLRERVRMAEANVRDAPARSKNRLRCSSSSDRA